MNEARLNKIKELIRQGEGVDVEFKESKTELNKNVFETVVAFLNKNGGHLLLGVTDKGKISGVENPKIARVFKEIGLADELGSGVRNLFKYCKIYANEEPEIIEEDIFKIKIVVPVDQVSDQVNDQAELVMEFCKNPQSIKDIMEYLGYSNRTYFRKTFLDKLVAEGKIKLTIPEKPSSPKQKYVTCNSKRYGS